MCFRGVSAWFHLGNEASWNCCPEFLLNVFSSSFVIRGSCCVLENRVIHRRISSLNALLNLIPVNVLRCYYTDIFFIYYMQASEMIIRVFHQRTKISDNNDSKRTCTCIESDLFVRGKNPKDRNGKLIDTLKDEDNLYVNDYGEFWNSLPCDNTAITAESREPCCICLCVWPILSCTTS